MRDAGRPGRSAQVGITGSADWLSQSLRHRNFEEDSAVTGWQVVWCASEEASGICGWSQTARLLLGSALRIVGIDLHDQVEVGSQAGLESPAAAAQVA